MDLNKSLENSERPNTGHPNTKTIQKPYKCVQFSNGPVSGCPVPAEIDYSFTGIVWYLDVHCIYQWIDAWKGKSINKQSQTEFLARLLLADIAKQYVHQPCKFEKCSGLPC